MSPLALHLLRRIAVLALGAAALLLIGSRVLDELGVLGPDAASEIAATGRALQVARAYGASDDLPAMGAATRELDQARSQLASGHDRQARKTALRARADAVEAQRVALARRERVRHRAKDTVDGVDRSMNELEDLYARITPGMDDARVSSLLSGMKQAREAAGGLFLAYENGQYGKVIEEEALVKGNLAAMRRRLLDAAK